MNALFSPMVVARRWIGRAVSLLALAAAVSASAQESFVVLSNGPTSARINFVILSEGYTAAELATFRTDATNSINALLGEAPLAEYRHMFNGFGIAVASAESGSDHPSRGVYKNTYFNSTYDSYSTTRLITVPPNNYDGNYQNGSKKIMDLLNQFVPEWDIAMLLVNDTEYGGSGGGVLLASKHSSSAEIARHELGHSYARLGDEYTTPYPGYPAVEEPNTTRETNRANIKWLAWMNSSTPTPTPATSQYGSVVGLFQGAHYNSTGWYRPKLDCKMRSLGKSLCEVCSEAMILSTYSRIPPVGDISPSEANLVAQAGSTLDFSLNPVVPGASRSVQWSINAVPLAGATNSSLNLTSAQLVPGTNFVRCIVRDTTAKVRNDPSNKLQAVIEWRVLLSDNYLVLDPPVWLGAGRLALRVSGYAPKGLVLQATGDYNNWTDISVHGPVDGALNVTNIVPSSISALGFRAVATE